MVIGQIDYLAQDSHSVVSSMNVVCRLSTSIQQFTNNLICGKITTDFINFIGGSCTNILLTL